MRLWRGVKNHFIPTADNAYRPHLLHRSWLLFFLAVTLGTEGFLVANLVARQTDQNFLAAVIPAEIVALTNTEREANDVGDLTQNTLLQSAARAKANDMAQKGYFSHNGPDGKTPWQWIAESGYQYQYAGENLAVRFIDSSDVVNAWMQSPTHRANMVKPVYTQIGVGVAQGLFNGEPATYVVQYFGTPALAEAQPAVPVAIVQTPVPSTRLPASTSTPAVRPVVQAPAPQVEGASSVVPPIPAPAAVAQSDSAPLQPGGSSWTQTLLRQLIRVFANPQQSAAWVLGGIAALLILVLGLTFLMHAQIQPVNLLMNGALVAALAVSFLTVNAHLSEAGSGANPEAAGVAESISPGGVLIDSGGASTGYALFPQSP